MTYEKAFLMLVSYLEWRANYSSLYDGKWGREAVVEAYDFAMYLSSEIEDV